MVSSKTVRIDSRDLPINVPRDRNSEFEPLLIKKHKRRLEDIGDAVFKMLSLAIDYITKKWTMPIQNWNQAMAYFLIKFEGRI